jgi:hypothetical protein
MSKRFVGAYTYTVEHRGLSPENVDVNVYVDADKLGRLVIRACKNQTGVAFGLYGGLIVEIRRRS